MLKLIIEKEIRDIIKSSKFVYMFAICAVLIILTFYVGGKNYLINRAQYEAAIAENNKTFEKMVASGQIEPNIILPPEPIMSLVAGVSNDVGRDIQITTAGNLTATGSKYNEDPIYAVFRFLDLEFLFQMILALFAILCMYNAINGEKERGTLALTFSNSIPRHIYILAKVVGSFISMFVTLLIPILIGCLLLPLIGVPMIASDWLKLIMILLTGFLFFGLFLILSIFMSTITKQSSASLLFMLVIWISAVVVFPRVAIIIAGRAVNVPTTDEINQKKIKYTNEQSKIMLNKIRDVQSQKKDDQDEQFKIIMKEYSNNVTDYYLKISRERENIQYYQENLALNISRISPSSCFTLAVSNIAGTSLELNRDYLEQAYNYQNILRKMIDEKIKSTDITKLAMSGNTSMYNINDIPLFIYITPSFSKYIPRVIIDLSILIIMNLIFFAASFFTFLKYDLR